MRPTGSTTRPAARRRPPRWPPWRSRQAPAGWRARASRLAQRRSACRGPPLSPSKASALCACLIISPFGVQTAASAAAAAWCARANCNSAPQTALRTRQSIHMGGQEGGASKKRSRQAAEDDDDAGPSGWAADATIGQQTSFIRNKQVRSEKYAKLKSKQKVGTGLAACMGLDLPRQRRGTGGLMRRRCRCALQKAKKAERKRRQKEDAKAEDLGLEPPPRKQQKVESTLGCPGGRQPGCRRCQRCSQCLHSSCAHCPWPAARGRYGSAGAELSWHSSRPCTPRTR